MDLARLDRGAVGRGAALAAVVAVPAGLWASALAEDSQAILPLSLLVMVALVAGASIAAQRQQVGLPLVHGIATALGVLLFAQVAGLIRRLLANDDIRFSKIVSNILLALIAGTIGGLIGSRRATR